MSGRRPEDFDYAMSPWYRRVIRGIRPPKEVVPKKPKTIIVAGMKLHNIAQDAILDEETFPKVLENLKTLGINPEQHIKAAQDAAATQETFLNPVATKKEKKKKKRITPKIFQVPLIFRRDPEKIMVLGSNDITRGNIQNAEDKHAEQVQQNLGRKKWREEHGLPPKRRPWKELMLEFNKLSPEDIQLLRDMGYRPDLVQNPHSDTVELYLKLLKDYHRSD